MITGDRRATAQAVAAALGIDTVRAEVLPTEKADAVAALQADGARSPSSATGSTMRRRWRGRMSGWPSAPGPTSPSKAPTWC
jgi:hypothetical protein